MLFVGFALCMVGCVLTLLMGVLFFFRRDEARTAERIARTPRTPAARAPASGLVEIHGVAQPSEHGILRSPSGRAALVYRVDVVRHGNEQSHTLRVVRDRRPFYLDDGSGVCARVETGEGVPMIAASHVYGPPSSTIVIGGTPDTRGPLTAELAAWLQAMVGAEAFDPRVTVTETLIAPGDRVFAIGPCRWEPSARPLGGWQGREPVLRNLGKGEQELLLSNLDESRLLALFATRRKTRRVLLAVALGILAAGVVAMAVGLVTSLDVIRSFELPLK